MKPEVIFLEDVFRCFLECDFGPKGFKIRKLHDGISFSVKKVADGMEDYAVGVRIENKKFRVRIEETK